MKLEGGMSVFRMNDDDGLHSETSSIQNGRWVVGGANDVRRKARVEGRCCKAGA